MSATIGDAFSSFKEAFGLLFSKPGPILSDFAKVAALGLVVQFVLSGITLIIATAMGIDLSGITEPPLEFMVLAIVIAVPIVIINAALNATPYHLVDERQAGRAGDIIKKTLSLLLPMGRYMLSAAAIFIGLVVGMLALGALGSALDPLVGLVILLIGSISILLVVFALQFAVPEIVLRGSGAIESIKTSWKMASSNAVAVVVFDVILLGILTFFIMLSAVLAASRGTAMAGDLVGLAYSMFVSLLTSMIMTMLTILPFYFFWKKVALPVAPRKSAASSEETKAKPVPKRKARRSKR